MDAGLLTRAYRAMALSRGYEEKVNQLYADKVSFEKPLCGIGQEATSVGSVIGLAEKDFVVPSLRAKGAFFARGWTLREGFLELLRKEDSRSHGLWTSHHVGDMDRNIVISSAVLASSLSVASGIALAQKLQNTSAVVVAFFGEGSSSRADAHTAINFSSVLNLPIVFICENNLYALSTKIDEQMKNHDICDRAVGYGIPGEKVDGQDVVKVIERVSEAIARARYGEGPSLIECKTYRYRGHTESHDPIDGRDLDEYNFWLARDPLTLCADFLIENNIATVEEIKGIGAEIASEVESALEFALNAKDAEYIDIKKYVYAE